MKRAGVIAILIAACGPTMSEDDVVKAKSKEQALSVCAGPVTVPGIVVSEYQGNINWQDVANAGYRFAITRINDGYHQDPYFQGNWAAIKSVGMYRGAYQFYEPTIDPTTQANWVIAAVGQLGPGDLPVTLDVEWTSGTPNANDIGSWAFQVAIGTGKIPMIYTALGYWDQYFTSEFSNLDLWVANYGVNCPGMPSSWNSWLFWQWGGGAVPGISGNVDGDVFNGSEQDLATAAGQQTNSGCTAGLQVGCSHFGCSCASGSCSGGFCPGTGCSQPEIDACGNFGVNCVDQQCAGGFGPGTGCTAKETNDCGNFGCGCVDHACNGGFCPGTGCTPRETLDCNDGGYSCAGHACTAAPVADAGTPPAADAGMVMTPPPSDAGHATTDAGSSAESDAGVMVPQSDGGAGSELPMGTGVDPSMVPGNGKGTMSAGHSPASKMTAHGGCDVGLGAPFTALALLLLARKKKR